MNHERAGTAAHGFIFPLYIGKIAGHF